MNLLETFLQAGRMMDRPTVVEMGVCRSNPAVATRHDSWFPDAGRYVGTDFQAGLDVDVVADAHRFAEAFEAESIDVLISCSVFEHIKYPLLAAHEMMKTMKVGGLLFIQTHQTFPIHAYPYDYHRFSREGLAALFGTRNGMRVLQTCYEFPAVIQSERDPNTATAESYLNVCLYAQKFAPTPDEFRYEFDMPDEVGCEISPVGHPVRA